MGLVRLLLAVAVVVAHSSPLFGLSLTGGIVAVQAFYIISGFYISLILNEKYKPGFAGNKLFYSNRFLRIYPIYWTVLLLTIYMAVLERYYDSIHAVQHVSQFIGNLSTLRLDAKLYVLITNFSLVGLDWGYFMRFDTGHIQATLNFYPYSPKAADMAFVPQAWTLGLEVIVYVMAPFIFRRKLWLLIGIVAVSTGLRAFAYTHDLNYDPWTSRFLPFELALFVLGSIAYKAYKAVPVFSNRFLGWASLAAVLGLTFGYSGLPSTPSIVPGFYSGQLIYLLVVFAALPAIFNLSKSNKIDRWIGELSYPVYLTHMIVIPICNGYFGPGNIYPVLGTIIVSMLIVLIIDRPLDRFRQRRVENAAKSERYVHSSQGLGQPSLG